jgi:hypothetical protein
VIRNERCEFQDAASHYVPYRMGPLFAEALCLCVGDNIIVSLIISCPSYVKVILMGE